MSGSHATATAIDPLRLMRLVADTLDHSDDVVAVLERTDPTSTGPTPDELRFVSVNDAFCRVTGYRMDDVAGRPFTLLACAATGAEPLARLATAVADRRSLRTEMLCATARGAQFWFGLHLMPAADPDFPGQFFVLLGRDISARLQASQQQRAIQELLANVFLLVDAAVAIVGADGRFLMTNPQLDRMLRYPVGALTGRPTVDFVTPDSRTPAAQAHKQQFEDHKHFTLEVQGICGDGTILPMRLTSVPITRADLPRCRIVTAVELTPPPAPPEVQVAGKIKLVGLEEVRAALGPQWEAMAARALSSAEHVIQRRLGPADTYSRTQDQGFLICFAGMTEEEASFRAAMIGREIRARLIGQGEDPASSQVSAITTSVKLVEGQDRSPDSLRTMLEERLNARRAEIEAEAQKTLMEAVQSATCQLEAIHGRAGNDTVARYACLPQGLERKIYAAMSVLPSGPGGGAEFDLDALMLSLAAERSMQTALKGAAALILVNVSFDTFATRSRTDRYVELCGKLDPKLRQRLVLMLSQLPSTIGRSRVLDCANRLRPFCRGVGFEVDDIELPQVDLNLAGSPIVSLPADRWSGGPAQEQRLTTLLRALHTHRGRLLMRRVPGWEAATQLRGLGVDLVSVEGEK